MKLFALALFLYGSSHLASAKDPVTEYFGGTDHDAYTSWLATSCYDQTGYIESTQEVGAGVALHWTIQNDNTIQLAVAARATGWVGFGLGESGSMLGADMVLYSAASDTLVDSYVLEQSIPPTPDVCQSWTLVGSTVRDGFIIFEATRLLNTGDTQDRVLADDSDLVVPSTRVLAAWGDTADPSFHGKNHAKSTMRFFGDASTTDEVESFAAAMEQEAQGNFTIHADNYTIPTDRTTYHHVCLTRDDLLAAGVPLDQDLHTIGIDSFINPTTRPLVHHFVLSASSDPWNASLPCEEYPKLENVYVWAPGEVPFRFPSNVGGPLGVNGFQSFTLQIHYHNGDGMENQVDDSGVRLYYTREKRPYDMGVFSTGDPSLALNGELVTPLGGHSEHVFGCPSSCTQTFLNDTLTVIRETFHMHDTGTSMRNAQIRNGTVIREGVVEYWDFDQQGNFAVAQPQFTIEPGDGFRTVCTYKYLNNETWGPGSEQEMCMTFLYYYPRRVIFLPGEGDTSLSCGITMGDILPGCESTYDGPTLSFTDARQLGRVFGTTVDNGTCVQPNNNVALACPGVATNGPNGTTTGSSSSTAMAMGFVTGLAMCSVSLLASW